MYVSKKGGHVKNIKKYEIGDKIHWNSYEGVKENGSGIVIDKWENEKGVFVTAKNEDKVVCLMNNDIAKRVIKMYYLSVDGCYKSAKFSTIEGAKKFAKKWLGDYFVISFFGHAISGDGIGKVSSLGCSMEEILGKKSVAWI